MSKGVGLNPETFSTDGGLLDLSLEEVVSLHLDQEKRRHKERRDDENQQEDIVGCRSVPTGLVMALDSCVNRLGITRSLLTRCLSHQAAAWVESLPKVKELTKLFNDARDAANDYGYPDLYESMNIVYSFRSVSPHPVTFRTIRWVKNNLLAVARPLGMSVGALFVVGLCFSLSKATEGGKGTVVKYLSSEVAGFTRHVEEHFFRVSGFYDAVKRRAEAEGKKV